MDKRSPTMKFDVLTTTWERLAAEINAEFVTEEAEFDFTIDFKRFPFGDVIFKDMSPMENWPKFNRPRINLISKHWEIALRSTYPSSSSKDPFLVTVQANFAPRTPFYIRTRERSVERSLGAWFLETGLGTATQTWAKSWITDVPYWMLFMTKPVIGGHRVRSGLSDFDSNFSIEATDEKIADRLFASLLPQPLLAIKDSLKVLVFQSMADSESNCVFLHGRVNAEGLDQSRQLLTFVEVALDTLLSLGLISSSHSCD